MLTAAQHAIRQQGISGSDIAPVLGLSTFKAPIDIWREKKGYACPHEENEDMQRGRILEPAIIQWYREATGLFVAYDGAKQRTWVSTDHPLVRATPDGIAYAGEDAQSGATHPVEAKAPNLYQLDDWGTPGTDAIKPQYVLQCHWQMEATGLRTHVDVPVFFGDRFELYRVDWNQRLFDVALERATDWWNRHILGDSPPPIDGTPSYAQWLADHYPAKEKPDKTLISGDEYRELIDRYLAAKEQAKAADVEKRRLENEIKAAIGGGYGIEAGNAKVLWLHCHGKAKIDWEAIARHLGANEDVINDHTTNGKAYRQLRARIKGE